MTNVGLWPRGRCLGLVALAAVLAVVGATATGCYAPSSPKQSEVHSTTVDDKTFTQVSNAIAASGLSVEGGNVLMFRESDTRVRAEGAFTAEDGKRYGVVIVERSGQTWKVVSKS